MFRIARYASSFKEVSSNHWIVSAKMFLSLHRNKKQNFKSTHYDWHSLTNCDMRNEYMVNVRNKLDTLQEIFDWHTPNNEYENFVTNNIKAAAECIQTKPKPKCRVRWETIAFKKKWENMQKASLLNKRNPTNTHAGKLKKAQREQHIPKRNN